VRLPSSRLFGMPADSKTVRSAHAKSPSAPDFRTPSGAFSHDGQVYVFVGIAPGKFF
jgi:hypothetical protein